MAMNTKFLNSLQPEWNKYVTNVRLTNKIRDDHYDVLFDHLQQYEGLVNASREKRAAKIHDPLALVANKHASSSSSRSSPAYYVMCRCVHRYAVSSLMDTTYRLLEQYCDKCALSRHRYAVSSLMDMAYRLSEQKNVGNSGRYVRRITNNQGDSAGNVNVQKDTRNTTNAQRIIRNTTNSGNATNVQCYN
ncbi:hypothetical protein Tco_0636104 [Tanacetum coccineum]